MNEESGRSGESYTINSSPHNPSPKCSTSSFIAPHPTTRNCAAGLILRLKAQGRRVECSNPTNGEPTPFGSVTG